MKKVQDVFREVFPAAWRPGLSKCYRDTSYTKTKRKVRFKFDYIRLREEGKFIPCGMKNTNPSFEDLYAVQDAFCKEKQQQLKAALAAAGHINADVLLWVCDSFGDQVIVTQEFPIEIKELA